MTLDPVTDAQWEALVARAPGVVLVDVWAAWCTPCAALSPVLGALAARHAGTLRVLALDADANPVTTAALGVRALPTVLVWRDGTEWQRLVGAQPAAAYEAAVAAALRGDAPARAPLGEGVGENGRGGGGAPSPGEAPEEAEAARLLAAPGPAVLFKHSRTCPVSHAAHTQVDAFRRAHPEIPVRTVVVQAERPLSDAVARMSGVRHESPQALVVRGGAVHWHGSHGAVTALRLAEACGR